MTRHTPKPSHEIQPQSETNIPDHTDSTVDDEGNPITFNVNANIEDPAFVTPLVHDLSKASELLMGDFRKAADIITGRYKADLENMTTSMSEAISQVTATVNEEHANRITELNSASERLRIQNCSLVEKQDVFDRLVKRVDDLETKTTASWFDKSLPKIQRVTSLVTDVTAVVLGAVVIFGAVKHYSKKTPATDTYTGLPDQGF